MIITITNQKGGTGKTTTSINLSAWLANFGKKVLLVDLDPQANATSGLDVRVGKKCNLYDFLMSENVLEEVVCKSKYQNLYLIPGSSDVAGAGVEMVNVPEREFVLRKKLLQLEKEYDFVIVDSPPSLGILTLNGLVAADKVMIPVQCEYYALEGLGQLMETVSLIRTNLREDLDVLGALLTMHDRRNRLSYQVMMDVKKNFPGKVFETVIPRNVSLSEAPSFGKAIHDYALLSKGSFAYRQLAKEVIKITS
jgi:chromosome partitioning protein